MPEYKKVLSSSAQSIYQGVGLFGKHPFVTGLLALLGILGLVFSIYGFDLDRKDAADTTQQIEVNTRQILEAIMGKNQDLKDKDEQIKALTEAINALTNNTGELGSKAQTDAALLALSQGNTDKAKALFAAVAKKGEQDLQQTIQAYQHLGALAFLDNTEQALDAYHRVIELDPNNMVSWNQLGHLYDRIGQLDDAIMAYTKVLEWGEKNQNDKYIAAASGNLGTVYQTRGELDKAIDYHEKSLAIHEALGRKEGIAGNYGNLGNVYHTRGELDKAIDYYEKSLAIDKALGRKEGIAIKYGNLGVVYQTRGELDKAIDYYEKSLAIDKALGRKEGIAIKYGNLGIVYQIRGALDKAIGYHEKALALSKALGRKEGMASNYGNLGAVYQIREESDKAKDYYNLNSYNKCIASVCNSYQDTHSLEQDLSVK